MGHFQSERIEPPGKTFEEEFNALVTWLERDTNHASMIKAAIEHPAFTEIVNFGVNVLPLIEARDIAWWEFAAINRIFNDRPEIPEADRGRLKKMREIYREWLKQKHKAMDV